MSAAGDKPVVLCIDDDPDLLALMAKALGGEYRVLTAGNPGDGIAAATGDPRPDLVLLDVDMPDVSGMEVCQALKGEPETAAIPVVFLTARSDMKQQVEGLQMGAVDYITKPFNAFVLRARVRIHIALASRRHELEHLVQERTAQLEGMHTELLHVLSRAMEMHETTAVGNRVTRLGHYAKLISQAAGGSCLRHRVRGNVGQHLVVIPHAVEKIGHDRDVLRATGVVK